MYICYLDESGHCGTKFNPRQPVELVCGVLLDLTKLAKSQRQHAQIIDWLKKTKIATDELKAADIYRGRNQWADVSADNRKWFIDFIIDWASERACKFIPCPIDSKKFFEMKAAGDKNACVLGFPYEAAAMNAVLAVQRLQKSKKNNKGRTFLVFDEQSKHDRNLLQVIGSDIDGFDSYYGFKMPTRKRREMPQRLDQIVDQPFFAKSTMSVMVQVADVAAFVFGRHIQLKCLGEPESFEGEVAVIENWVTELSGMVVTHTAIDPPGSESLCLFFRDLRPVGWSARGLRDNSI